MEINRITITPGEPIELASGEVITPDRVERPFPFCSHADIVIVVGERRIPVTELKGYDRSTALSWHPTDDQTIDFLREIRAGGCPIPSCYDSRRSGADQFVVLNEAGDGLEYHTEQVWTLLDLASRLMAEANKTARRGIRR